MNRKPIAKILPVIFIIMVFITRIPLITGLFFQADGDESIVGLMAKEIADHNNYKVYFWGQRYGFVLFETGTAALSFHFFGVNEYALKLTMLFWWAIACLLLYASAKNLIGLTGALIFISILILCPAWGLWSMKARGGYLTSYLFSALIFWLMSSIFKNPEKNIISIGLLWEFVLQLFISAKNYGYYHLSLLLCHFCLKAVMF